MTEIQKEKKRIGLMHYNDIIKPDGTINNIPLLYYDKIVCWDGIHHFRPSNNVKKTIVGLDHLSRFTRENENTDTSIIQTLSQKLHNKDPKRNTLRTPLKSRVSGSQSTSKELTNEERIYKLLTINKGFKPSYEYIPKRPDWHYINYAPLNATALMFEFESFLTRMQQDGRLPPSDQLKIEHINELSRLNIHRIVNDYDEFEVYPAFSNCPDILRPFFKKQQHKSRILSINQLSLPTLPIDEFIDWRNENKENFNEFQKILSRLTDQCENPKYVLEQTDYLINEFERSTLHAINKEKLLIEKCKLIFFISITADILSAGIPWTSMLASAAAGYDFRGLIDEHEYETAANNHAKFLYDYKVLAINQ